MKHSMQIMVIVVTIIAFSSALVLAQEMGHGMMEKGQGMSGMGQQGGMGAMQKKMQDLEQHEKMMEGIKDQNQMMTEMRKHMQMMTDMMEEMMRQQGGATSSSGSISEQQCCKLGGMSGKPDATSGSGGMSEHQ